MAESDWIDIDENTTLSQATPTIDQGEWVDIDAAQPRQLKPSTQQLLDEQAAARQAIISQAQEPGLNKFIEGSFNLGKGIATPVVSMVKGIGGIPDLVADPSRIPATVGETSRRLGMDLVQLGEFLRPKTAAQLALGPLGVLAGKAIEGIGELRSYTPNEQQIQERLLTQEEAAPLQQAIQEERNRVAFEGAQPEFSEGLNQAIQTIVPIAKGASLVKGTATGIAGVPRMIRSAIKPSEASVGVNIEKAAASEISDIFHANPNADKIAATPMEGVAIEVKTAFNNAGKRIGELRAQSGTTLNAGNVIADKILEKAVSLEDAGQPRAMLDEMVNRAQDIRRKMADINSLQDGVTIANRKSNILKPKSTADGFVDEIISKEGGALINKELKTLGGPEGASIRKKWSNLKLLSENFDERVNKIINNAPIEARSTILETLASPEGVAGVFALVNGWALPGALALGSKFVKNWAKNEIRDLKNSNSIIQKTYNTLRKTPPPRNISTPIPAQTLDDLIRSYPETEVSLQQPPPIP